MQSVADFNSWLNGYVWGWPTIILLVGTGLLLTVVTGFAQVRLLGFTAPPPRVDSPAARS